MPLLRQDPANPCLDCLADDCTGCAFDYGAHLAVQRARRIHAEIRQTHYRQAMAARAEHRLDLAPDFTVRVDQLSDGRFAWVAVVKGHRAAAGVASTETQARRRASVHNPELALRLNRRLRSEARARVEQNRRLQPDMEPGPHARFVGQSCPWPRLRPFVHYQTLPAFDTGRIYSGRYRDLLRMGFPAGAIIALDTSAPAPIGKLWAVYGISRKDPTRRRLYDFYDTKGAANSTRQELIKTHGSKIRVVVKAVRDGAGTFSSCALQYETWQAHLDGKLTVQDIKDRYRHTIRKHGESLLADIARTMEKYGYACIGSWSGAQTRLEGPSSPYPPRQKSVDNSDVELTAALAQATDHTNDLLEELYAAELASADERGKRPEPEVPEGYHVVTYNPGPKLARITGPDPEQPMVGLKILASFSHRHLCAMWLKSKGHKVVDILPQGCTKPDWWTEHMLPAPYRLEHHTFMDIVECEVPKARIERAPDGPTLHGMSVWEVQQWLSKTLTDLKVLPEIRNR